MTDEKRCEPPGLLRCVDGWHWLNLTNNPDEIWRWDEQCRAWGNANSVRASSIQMASYGYRYVAPATPPATVAALVEALDDLLADTQHATHDCGDDDCPVRRARAALALYRGEEEEE